MKVTVIDYGLSNLLSVTHAFEHFGAEVEVTGDPAAVLAADALVLPGVGAFRDGMQGLEKLGLVGPLRTKAAGGTPLLGICLGMQMLFDDRRSSAAGRAWAWSTAVWCASPPPPRDGSRQRVPHIGWEPLYPAGGRLNFHGTPLEQVEPGRECYFIHSYEALPATDDDRLADTVYGGRRICAAVAHGNVYGTQFHPEKSGPVGLSIIEGYLRMCERR